MKYEPEEKPARPQPVWPARPPVHKVLDRSDLDRCDEQELEQLIKSIIAKYGSPARVLELYQLSEQPGGLEMIRSLMALPEKGRIELRSFLMRAPNPQLISVDVDSWGQLRLSLPEIVEAMLAMRRMAVKA